MKKQVTIPFFLYLIKGLKLLSLERILSALISLGLSREDSEIDLFIAKNGPKEVIRLQMSLNYSQSQIKKSLNILKAIGLVKKKKSKFSAIPLEDALERLIEREMQQTQSVEEIKKEFLVNLEKEQ